MKYADAGVWGGYVVGTAADVDEDTGARVFAAGREKAEEVDAAKAELGRDP